MFVCAVLFSSSLTICPSSSCVPSILLDIKVFELESFRNVFQGWEWCYSLNNCVDMRYAFDAFTHFTAVLCSTGRMVYMRNGRDGAEKMLYKLALAVDTIAVLYLSHLTMRTLEMAIRSTGSNNVSVCLEVGRCMRVDTGLCISLRLCATNGEEDLRFGVPPPPGVCGTRRMRRGWKWATV